MARIEATRQTRERVIKVITSRCPEASEIYVMVGTKEVYAEFKFPGSKYKAQWRTEDPDHIYYCKADEEAAIAYFKLKEIAV
jgi:hypothetical protein